MIIIIGLIVGGVVVGQDLIASANLRAQVSDVERINTATNTFRLKYNCLPGDCKNATTFFAASSQPEQTSNGDGNKLIEVYHSPSGVWGWLDEAKSYFDHLALGGLLPLTPYNETSGITAANSGLPLKISPLGNDPMWQPPVGTGLYIGYEPAVDYIPAGHKIAIGGNIGLTVTIAQFGKQISQSQAYAIDSKIDDGKPFSGTSVAVGRVYTHDVTDSHADSAESSATLCGDKVENRYRLNDPEQHGGEDRVYVCRLHVNAKF